MENTFDLIKDDLGVTCHTFQCHNKATYFIGKPDTPRGTEYFVCEECAQELRNNIINEYLELKYHSEAEIDKTAIVDETATVEPAEDVLFGKPVADWTVAELKDKAFELNVHLKSKANKAEIVEALAHE